MAVTSRTIDTVNPATGRRLETYALHGPEEVERSLRSAVEAAREWAGAPADERAGHLLRAAAALRHNSASLARLITAEMGKPIVESRAEVEKCAFTLEHFAQTAPGVLRPRLVPSDTQASEVWFQPLGSVLAVMPWNFPLWQVVRFAAPALAAGNTGILKHASNVTGCALALEAALAGAGLPPGVFQSLVLDHETLEALIGDVRISAVTLTGSDASGSRIAALAGHHLKKTVLELGGSDPFVVLGDADIGRAAEVGVHARFQNAGQSCIAAKRFIVVDSVADQFVEEFAGRVARLRVGDPLEEDTEIGPLAREDLRDNLAGQVSDSVREGARLLAGGKSLEGPGFYYAPTVLDGVEPQMRVFREETFGPVASITRVPDEDRAVALANASVYGLGANLWTQDVERARRLAARLEAGGVFINGMTHSDARLPFGGLKRSGYGRELSDFGLMEFVNIKTVWMPSEGDSPPATPSE
jgi:succinate-semialdehyde dehydrogenase/glutarate-semialdehyde dehydrogenase